MIFEIDIEMYHTKIYVAIESTTEEIVDDLHKRSKKRLSKEYIRELVDLNGSLGRTIKLTKGLIILLLKKHEQHILAHEVHHVIQRISEHIGSQINEHTEEPFAYLQGYITKRINDEFSRRGKGNVATELNG